MHQITDNQIDRDTKIRDYGKPQNSISKNGHCQTLFI